MCLKGLLQKFMFCITPSQFYNSIILYFRMTFVMSQPMHEIMKNTRFNTKQKMLSRSKYLNFFLYSLFIWQMEQ